MVQVCYAPMLLTMLPRFVRFVYYAHIHNIIHEHTSMALWSIGKTLVTEINPIGLSFMTRVLP